MANEQGQGKATPSAAAVPVGPGPGKGQFLTKRQRKQLRKEQGAQGNQNGKSSPGSTGKKDKSKLSKAERKKAHEARQKAAIDAKLKKKAAIATRVEERRIAREKRQNQEKAQAPTSQPKPQDKGQDQVASKSAAVPKTAESEKPAMDSDNAWRTDLHDLYDGFPEPLRSGFHVPPPGHRPPPPRGPPFHHWLPFNPMSYPRPPHPSHPFHHPQGFPSHFSGHRFPNPAYRGPSPWFARPKHRQHFTPGPRPRAPDPEVLKERTLALKKAQESIQQDFEATQKKNETRSKVAELKEKLKKNPSDGTSKIDLINEAEKEKGAKDDSRREDGQKQVNRDFVLSNDDFREIGSGRLNATETTADQPNLALEFPDFMASYAKSTDAGRNAESAKDRRANEPSWTQVEWWQAQKRKEDARRLEEAMDLDEEEVAAEEISESEPVPSAPLTEEEKRHFSKMAENVKTSILNRCRSELKELVDSPSNMKRVLMKKLFNSHRNNISARLNKLRFNGMTYTDGGESDLSQSMVKVISDLEAKEDSLQSVDLDKLPDAFIMQIEDFIKKERFENMVIEDDEIQEVPVPPKPPVPLIDLEPEDHDEQENHADSATIPAAQPSRTNLENSSLNNSDLSANGNIVQPSENAPLMPVQAQTGKVPMTYKESSQSKDSELLFQLRAISEEERRLMEENNSILAQIQSNNQRLECLNELRMNLLGTD